MGGEALGIKHDVSASKDSVHPGRDMTKMVERAMMSSFIRDRLLRRPGGELTRKSEGDEFELEDMVKAAQAVGDYGNVNEDVVT